MRKISPLEKLDTTINIPPDKSISHRALLLSSISKGKTEIKNLLVSGDTLATLDCINRLGLKTFNKDKNKIVVESGGKYFSKKRQVSLYAQGSGTTMRIISGMLVGQPFHSILKARGSLQKRPMKRITLPLRTMGANIKGKLIGNNEYPPLMITPAESLKGIRYFSPQGSAQVKSAIILASLFAKGTTHIKEPYISRDHTERMLKVFGAKIKKYGNNIICQESDLKTPKKIFIPGDFSSASFFIVLGLILGESELLIKNVGINPTRTGLLNVLRRMKANIRIINKSNYFEPYCDILVKTSHLEGTVVKKEEIPSMIDEIPILLTCASFAKGKTLIYGLKELRVKETDRIHSMVYNLNKAGIDIEARPYKNNWMVKVRGSTLTQLSKKIRSTRFKSFGDHRTAMSLIIFSLASTKINYIDEVRCINKSFPEFIPLINKLY